MHLIQGRDSSLLKAHEGLNIQPGEARFSLDGNAAIVEQHDGEGSAGSFEVGGQIHATDEAMKPEATVARPYRVGLRHVKDPLTEDDELTL